jgi:hypothetical protein
VAAEELAMKAPLDIALDDADAERVRRSHGDAIRELQGMPAASTVIIADVSLANGVDTPVPHRLGRRPRMVIVSPPRGASTTGRITEVRTGSHDRTQVVVLRADGWGATVAVDLAVMLLAAAISGLLLGCGPMAVVRLVPAGVVSSLNRVDGAPALTRSEGPTPHVNQEVREATLAGPSGTHHNATTAVVRVFRVGAALVHAAPDYELRHSTAGDSCTMDEVSLRRFFVLQASAASVLPVDQIGPSRSSDIAAVAAARPELPLATCNNQAGESVPEHLDPARTLALLNAAATLGSSREEGVGRQRSLCSAIAETGPSSRPSPTIRMTKAHVLSLNEEKPESHANENHIGQGDNECGFGKGRP